MSGPDLEALRKRLAVVARRFLRHAADVEDVVQEAILRVVQTRSNGQVVRDTAAFGTRVTVRLCIDQLRAARRKRKAETEADGRGELRRPTPVLPSEVEELYAAIAHLPPRQAAVVTLRKLFELDYAEVAAVLGITEDCCRSHCRLGLERLRKTLVKPD
jgi:RNA polymerase sigma-70 factor, ECF subfamily